MPVSQSLSPVQFHGDTIFVVDHQGEPFAPMKPIIENLGLDWKAQQRKLSINHARWGMVNLTIPSTGGLQNTLCMPVRKLAGFLGTITPKKVREELRPKIVQYQNECDDALWNYWNTGHAKRPESATFQPIQPDLPLDDQNRHLITESERDLLNTIKELDTNNRQLSATLEETRVNYIKLLESHVSVLKARIESRPQGPLPEPVPENTVKIKPVRFYTNPEEHEAMRKMRREGYSINQISRAFGRSNKTVWRHVGGVRA